jgi:hypothetical protein
MATSFQFTVFAHDNPTLFTGLVLLYCEKTFIPGFLTGSYHIPTRHIPTPNQSNNDAT